LFFLDSGHPPAADSGMTDLALALNSLVFQQPASDPACHLGFFCLLSAASCLLPAACCLLPAVRCLLPPDP